MNLILSNKREPLSSLSTINGGLARFSEEMERAFDRFLGEPFGFMEPKVLRPEGWAPPLGVRETDTEATIRAEVPGILAGDLDIRRLSRAAASQRPVRVSDRGHQPPTSRSDGGGLPEGRIGRAPLG